MMLPMAAVNQAIKWVISSLTIALRVRLGRYAHERYVDGITNITWNQIHRHGPNGSTPAYERPDWLLTVQIHRFADMFPRLLADVIKPTFDWFVFTRLLSRFIGRKGSITMVLYVVLANIIIRLSSPPTGKHASRLAQLEEKYRGVYARISSTIQRAASASTPFVFQQQQQQQQQQNDRTSILSPDPSPHGTSPYASDLRPLNGNAGTNTTSANSRQRQQPQQQKQRAFVPRVQAGFRQRAKAALDGSLDNVASSVVSANIRRFFGGIGETILVKYGATLTAYYLLSRPLCSPGRRLASEILHDPAAVMMSYSRNSAYLINLSQATTRLLLMVNDLPKFVWSTVRVDRLLRALDVHARYRSAVENISAGEEADDNYSSAYSTD
ncbi:ABC transporter transmembrane region 2-domain-containing protein [Coemansia spiralis]|nr:ABC transporter transmembrane region 2-domain-containing protein [Coemansia spiralis]